MSISSTALIDPSAQIAEGVSIGPYSVIGPHVQIGAGSTIAAHVVIEAYTHLGENCQVSSGAVLGGLPQDMGFGGETSYVSIGNNVRIRECVTVNRATGEGKLTTIGDGSMLMAYSHLGHNCQVGANVILANTVQLGGYVEIGDYAFIGGGCVIHQFVKVGRMAILGGFSATRQDLPPFMMADSCPADIKGINSVGLRRRGLNLQERLNLKKAYHIIWRSHLNLKQAIELIEQEIQADPYVEELLMFMQQSKRGVRLTKKVTGSLVSNDAELVESV